MNRYVICDARMTEVNGCTAEYFEIIDGLVVFYRNYDTRQVEMVINLGLGWTVHREESE